MTEVGEFLFRSFWCRFLALVLQTPALSTRHSHPHSHTRRGRYTYSAQVRAVTKRDHDYGVDKGEAWAKAYTQDKPPAQVDSYTL